MILNIKIFIFDNEDWRLDPIPNSQNNQIYYKFFSNYFPYNFNLFNI